MSSSYRSGWHMRERKPAGNRKPQAVLGTTCGFLWLVARGGVEPPTFRFSVGRSYQLSYLAVVAPRIRGAREHLTGAFPAPRNRRRAAGARVTAEDLVRASRWDTLTRGPLPPAVGRVGAPGAGAVCWPRSSRTGPHRLAA